VWRRRGAGSDPARRDAAVLVQPIDEIFFEDASPARRELNHGWPLAERDQTLERAARDSDEPGDLVVAVDGERRLPSPRCGIAPFAA
jgi:hypothetical protein